MSANTEQPKPIATNKRPIWPVVIEYVQRNYIDDGGETTVTKLVADMTERDRIGRERYGVALTAGNGRDSMIDAFQELLDFVVYTRTWLEEHDIDPVSPGITMFGNPEDPDDTREPTPQESVMCNLFCAATEALLQLRGMLP